jgi:cytochrome c553
MTRRWRTIAAFVAVLAAVGLVTVVSGIVPIEATSGHWPITAWLLHFSMRRSVSTHTLGLQAPPLDEPWLAIKGAAHYESGCRGCHGTPEQPRPTIAQQMTPSPPYLPEVIASWEPAELFYIVKHGVKFTGMPGWPAQQREDEVWAMVAFLLRLPGLDAEGYRRLVDGESSTDGTVAPRHGPSGLEAATPAVLESCRRCHGVDGGGRGVPAFPRLAGQRPAYLLAALQAFARRERHSGIMAPVASELRPEEMRDLAVYYGGLAEPASPEPPGEAAPAIERGQAIARRGIPSQRVPSCVDCHGPGEIPRNPAYPRLAGQYAEYLVLQLELFKEGRRGGSAYARLMRPVAARLTSEQMRDVALYYESLRR